ncbi:MAG: biotin--[acetyl-CoA-carboxylase] ligase [Solirubrobacteraceae bacterium]
MMDRARLGFPRLHLRRTDSTNTRARELAQRGAPHGTLVTAAEQLAGRGRQGRAWAAPAERALLCSVVLRDPPRLTALVAGVAAAELVAELAPGRCAEIKWPNDVLLDGRKVAGILVEGRPQDRWAVLGVGLNVALEAEDFPPQLRARAGTLGLGVEAIEPALARMLELLEHRLSAPERDVVEAMRARDALRGQPVRWAGGEGIGAGIDDHGLLLVATAHDQVTLDSGEVHLSCERSVS